MIRELVGGIYFGRKIEGSQTGMKYAEDDCKYTDKQVRRIAIVAFEEARKRKALLANIHKANVLATSRFWREVVEDAGKSYPDVEYRSMLVDNAAFQLVKNPLQFNGVVLLEKGYRTLELAAPGYDKTKILTTRDFGDIVADMI
jgi:3-isopropylmalate dehydrogenase